MDLIGTQCNLQQQFIGQYSQEPTSLQLSLEDGNVLSVTAAGQTYGGTWSQSFWIHLTMQFTIGSTQFHYQGFVQSVGQQYGMGGAVAVNDEPVGTWNALSTPAS